MTKTKSLILCALFAALIGVGARLTIPTPIIPITLQTLFVFLSGLLLGKKRGASAALVYALLGLAGLPVFSKGGGFWYVLEPSFGYIVSFIFASYAIGVITEKKPDFIGMLIACIAGTAIIYAVGILYYFLVSHFYLAKGIDLSKLILLPLPGDIISALFAAFLGVKIRKYI